MSIALLLIVLAFVAFVLAAVGFPSWKTNWIAVGLGLWALSEILGGMKL